MNEILCEDVRCVDDLRLAYRLTRRRRDGRMTYDLTLMLVQGLAREACTLQDIAPSEEKARMVYVLFCDELVTPMHAEDIMAEMLSSREYLWA